MRTGHAIQANRKSHLLPADAEARFNPDVEACGVEVNKIIEVRNKPDEALNLVILDACRDARFDEAK